MIPDTNRSILHRWRCWAYWPGILGIAGRGTACSLAAAARIDRSDRPRPTSPGEGPVTLSRRGTADTFRSGARTPSHRHRPSPTRYAPWAGEDYEQEGNALGFRPGYLSNLAYESVHDRFWVRGEFLGWWTKGFATPPLLTTSPTGTDPSQAGVLGAAGTSVLFGGDDLGGGFRPGERITFGAWLERRQTLGIEASYLQINRQTEFFNASGVTTPILARPFFNSQAGQQDSQLVNYPGQQSGTFSSAVASELQVAEVLVRKNLNRQPGLAVDLVAGYRYQQLEDHLAVDDTLTFSGTQSGFPAGSVVQQSDRFDTRNVFQGGVVGMSTSLHRQRWSIDSLLKIAVGQTHSRVAIDGATTTTIPGQAATCASGRVPGLAEQHGHARQQSVLGRAGIGRHLGLRFLAAVAGDHRLRSGLLEHRGPARRSDRPEPRPAAISAPGHHQCHAAGIHPAHQRLLGAGTESGAWTCGSSLPRRAPAGPAVPGRRGRR